MIRHGDLIFIQIGTANHVRSAAGGVRPAIRRGHA